MCFDLEKKSRGSFRDEARRLEAEFGQNKSRAPAELIYRGNFPPGGEIEAIVITNNPLIFGKSIFINIFNNTISSQTLSHLLCAIFVPKPQIGTCGLLVVLITPCS